MSNRLENKVAIVTGGAHGIGKAYALGLAKAGASIVIADLDEKAAENVAQIIEDSGGKALSVHTDVSSKESTLEMAKKAGDRFGRIDILINNAAMFAQVNMSRVGFMDIKEAEWDRMMAINIKGPWLCSQAVFPYMKEQLSGKIINISSSTIFGSPKRAHYVASKAALLGLTRTIAREVGEYGININTVCPGSTVTDDLDDPEENQRRIQGGGGNRALKRLEDPEDLVGTIVFLSSNESDFITGQTIVVDGGGNMI